MRPLSLLSLAAAAVVLVPAAAEAKGFRLRLSSGPRPLAAPAKPAQPGAAPRGSLVILPLVSPAAAATATAAAASGSGSPAAPALRPTTDPSARPVADAKGPWCAGGQVVGGFCALN